MNSNEKQVAEMAKILKNSTAKSVEYFQSEMKKAFANGAKHIARSECEKSLYDIQAEELFIAGYRKESETEKEIYQWLKMHSYSEEEYQLTKAFAESFGVEITD